MKTGDKSLIQHPVLEGVDFVDYIGHKHPVVDLFAFYGYIPYGSLPKTKLVKLFDINNQDNFRPGPLDFASYVFGLEKYNHGQVNLCEDEYNEVLLWIDKLIGPYLAQVPQYTPKEAFEALDPTKACGIPYNRTYGPTKGDVFKAYGYGGDFDLDSFHRDMISDFDTKSIIFSTTLKDELRPFSAATASEPEVRKNARFFMPAPIQSVYVGHLLFGAQNDSLMKTVFQHPVAMGLQIPGADLIQLFKRLEKHDGDFYDFDVPAWDANIVLAIVSIIRDVRIKYSKGSDHDRIRRYYDAVYAGFVNFDGCLIQVNGQRSGHLLTASDNSLVQLGALCLHAIRNKLTFHQFVTLVLAFLLGDDIILSDKTRLFNPTNLNSTYNSVGMYLETPSLHAKPLSACQFLSASPCKYQYGSREYNLYNFKLDKLLCSLNYTKKGNTRDKMFSKYVSICMMLFSRPIVFEEIRSKINALYTKQCFDGWIPDSGSQQLLRLLNDTDALFRLYVRFEDRREPGPIGTFLPECNYEIINFKSNIPGFQSNGSTQEIMETIISTAAPIVASAVAKKLMPKANFPKRKRRKSEKKVLGKRKRTPIRKKKASNRMDAPIVYGTKLSGMRSSQKVASRMIKNKFGLSRAMKVREVEGMFIMAAVMTPTAATPPYMDVYKTPLNPLAFPGSTLFDDVKNFQKFRFEFIKVAYVPIVATTATGGISLYFTDDAEYTFRGQPGTLQYLSSVMSTQKAVEGPIWKPMSIVKTFPYDGSEYYISPDLQGEERFCVQGRFGVVSSGNLNLGAQTVYGHLVCTYKLICWDEALTAENLDTWIQTPSQVAAGYTLQDQVSLLGLPVQVNGTNCVSAGLTSGVVYAIVPNYSLGEMKAFNQYFIKPVSATISAVYTTRFDAANGTTENTVNCSTFFADLAPAASFFFALPGGLPDPELEKNSVMASIKDLIDANKLTPSQVIELDMALSKLKVASSSSSKTTGSTTPKEGGVW